MYPLILSFLSRRHESQATSERTRADERIINDSSETTGTPRPIR
jgi:hypothetical protein